MRQTLRGRLVLMLTASTLAAALGIFAAPHAAARADTDPCAAHRNAIAVTNQAQPTDIVDGNGTIIGQIYATLWEQVGKDSHGNQVDCAIYRVTARACSLAGTTLPGGTVSAFLGDRYTNEAGFGGVTVGFHLVQDGDCTGVVATKWLAITDASPFTFADDPVYGTGNYAGQSTVVTRTFTPSN